MISLLLQCFGYGLLHGILPDEHTWPITFSYAVQGASGKKGIQAGFYFSLAFAFQRAIGSELAYLFLASWLSNPRINPAINALVGVVMIWAGFQMRKRGKYLHLHLLGHHHENPENLETEGSIISSHHKETSLSAQNQFPRKWAMIHGFIAGFGVGPFALFVYTVASPRMPSAAFGFLPGLLFGLGTMLMLAILGGVFGSALRTTGKFSAEEIKTIGSLTGSLTLLGGGIVFVLGGILESALKPLIPFDFGNALIFTMGVFVLIPVLSYSIWKVLNCRKEKGTPSEDCRDLN